MKRIKDIMKKENLVYVDENTPVRRVSRLLVERGISSVPVVNDKNELVGIIAKKEIVDVADAENLSELAAKDIMEKNAEYVKEDYHVEIAIRMFSERPYKMFPVLRGKILVGVITRHEILSELSGEYY